MIFIFKNQIKIEFFRQLRIGHTIAICNTVSYTYIIMWRLSYFFMHNVYYFVKFAYICHLKE